MGMCGPFSKSCHTSPIPFSDVKNNKTPPNPDPSRWELLKCARFINGFVFKVKYLDCTNYEGVKIMVYKGQMQNFNILQSKHLDPHFSDKTMSLTPFARFEPTEEGWEEACKLARNLNY